MAERTYSRDARSPVPKDERTSMLMSRIRAKNTGPERAMRQALRAQGSSGYRLHYKKAPGKPDIAFVGEKVAVFVHGCFWHGCPHCNARRPKSNRKFWNEKLTKNVQRDARKVRALRKVGWKVAVVWECRLRRYPVLQAVRVKRLLAR